MILCGILIVFFAWLLLHALIYSKSESRHRIIEGLDPSPSPSTPSPSTPSPSTPSPSTPSPSISAQAQIDENTAEIALLKTQIATLVATANQLNITMIQNEAGIQQNTALIQKVVQSQNDTNMKLANMKKAQ